MSDDVRVDVSVQAMSPPRRSGEMMLVSERIGGISDQLVEKLDALAHLLEPVLRPEQADTRNVLVREEVTGVSLADELAGHADRLAIVLERLGVLTERVAL